MDSKIEKSIVKFLTKEANIEELRELAFWIDNPENEALFLEFIKTSVFSNKVLKNYNKDQAKKVIASRIKQEKNKTRRTGILKYAAASVVIGLIITGYFYKDQWLGSPDNSTLPVVKTNTILPGTDKATLTLEDGSVVVLEKGQSLQTQNATSNGEQIVYNPKQDAGQQKPKAVNYNYLTIPRGGQYHLVLTDGTEVWLNSESKLKYPVQFVKGEHREVELVYGEAYFDVSHSSEHNGDTFKVISQEQEIEVLGTEFNVKAYQDETSIYTTLAEGGIALKHNGEKQVLTPGLQSNVNKDNSNIEVYTVDVKAETSWRHGLFVFKGKPLKEIAKVLSRWYDVDIIFMDKSLEQIKFRGVLSKNQSIDTILSIIQSNSLNNYRINGKTIFLE